MGSVALALLVVVVASFLFGVVTAPLGLVLGLPPALVTIGVFLGSAAFTVISVPAVVDRVPSRLARQVRRGIAHGPRVARWWAGAGAGRPGARAAVLLARSSSLLDRLGYRGVAVLAPVLGRWLVPLVGVASDPPRADLYRWTLLGCASWAVACTLGTDLLVHLLG